MKNFKEKADLIWRVADLLRGDYKQSDYGKVILPMTVLRRLDSILEPSKEKVLDALPRAETLKEIAKDLAPRPMPTCGTMKISPSYAKTNPAG